MTNNFIRRLARNIFKLTPYLPEEERKTKLTPEIQGAIADLARAQQAGLHRACNEVRKDNHNTIWKAADGWEKVASYPYEAFVAVCRQEGRDPAEAGLDSDFVKSFIKKNNFNVKVTRGTRGQEYGGTRYIKPGPVAETVWSATVDKLIKA